MHIAAGSLLLCAAVDPNLFSPLFPAPVKQINGNTTLIVSPALKFRLNASSSVVQAATERYARMMFAWGSSSKTCGAACVRQVEIEIADTSEKLHLGVDESYVLEVSSSGQVKINAPAVWGAIRALETLSQLVVWTGPTAGYELSNAPWAVQDSANKTLQSLRLPGGVRVFHA